MASPEDAAHAPAASPAPRRRGFGVRARDAVVAFWRKAYEENVTGLSGMVAYNLLLSIFPFALVALFIAGRVLRSEELQASLLADLQRIFPTAADSTLSEGIRRLQETSTDRRHRGPGRLDLVRLVVLGRAGHRVLPHLPLRVPHLGPAEAVRARDVRGRAAVRGRRRCSVPTVQALLVSGARDLPLGLSDVKGLVYGVTLAIGVVRRCSRRCARSTGWSRRRGCRGRPSGPARSARPLAIGVVDLGFPLYLDNISTLRVGTSAVFVLIALVWFYVIALIILAGAVVNGLRFEHRSRRPSPTD